MELESKALVTVDPSAHAMAEASKARIQAMYIMALKKPRSEDQARVRILEACRRPEFAARVEYGKPMGGKTIKGPSIRFAETALRLWENIESDIQVIYDDAKIRRIKIRMTDLETNASYTKELSINKTVERKSTNGRMPDEVFGERINTYNEKVFIVAATDDEMITKESSLISKAIRTEGLRLIPADIIDEALSTARETLRKNDAQDPAAAKKRILDAFASIGVKPKELEKYLKHGLDSISPAEIEDLRAVHAAIKEGDANWSDYINADKPAQSDQPARDFNEVFAAELADPEFAEWFNDLIVKSAANYKVSVEQAKADSIKQAEQIKALFQEHKRRLKPETSAPAPSADIKATVETKTEMTPPAADDFRSKWINLKEAGFSTFVFKNIDKFRSMQGGELLDAVTKWQKIYPTFSCPFVAKKPAEDEQQASGEAQGEGKTVLVGGNPPNFEEVELARLKAEIAMHERAHRDAVRQALADTGITLPTTIDACRVVLDSIEARISNR